MLNIYSISYNKYITGVTDLTDNLEYSISKDQNQEYVFMYSYFYSAMSANSRKRDSNKYKCPKEIVEQFAKMLEEFNLNELNNLPDNPDFKFGFVKSFSITIIVDGNYQKIKFDNRKLLTDKFEGLIEKLEDFLNQKYQEIKTSQTSIETPQGMGFMNFDFTNLNKNLGK